jgi:hypothetical protein
MKRKITGIAQSPMNATRWCLDLDCGHEKWFTFPNRSAAKKPKTAWCERCAGTEGKFDVALRGKP